MWLVHCIVCALSCDRWVISYFHDRHSVISVLSFAEPLIWKWVPPTGSLNTKGFSGGLGLKKRHKVNWEMADWKLLSTVSKGFVISPNSNTFSDWRRTFHVSLVKTHQLPSETTTWTFDLHLIRLCSLEPLKIGEPAGVKQTMSLQVFFHVRVGSYNNTYNDLPSGNIEFCFP